jgi:hypothetical protein
MFRRLLDRIGRALDLARHFEPPGWHPDRMIAAQVVLYVGLGSSSSRRSGTTGRHRIHDVAAFRTEPLERGREPFDHRFRALAFVTGGGTKLVSRRGLEYRRCDDLR